MKKQGGCYFCGQGIDIIDYKNVPLLLKFMTRYGKIAPRYYTGVCLRHQKRMARAVKRARHMALVAFVR